MMIIIIILNVDKTSQFKTSTKVYGHSFDQKTSFNAGCCEIYVFIVGWSSFFGNEFSTLRNDSGEKVLRVTLRFSISLEVRNYHCFVSVR